MRRGRLARTIAAATVLTVFCSSWALEECTRDGIGGCVASSHDSDVETFELLQRQKQVNQGESTVLTGSGRGDSAGEDEMHDMETMADLNILAFTNGTCERGGLTKKAWMEIFSGLDADQNGVVSTAELHFVEDKPLPGNHNLTARNHNLTMPQIKAGLALVARWYPEEASRLMAHEALITALAYKGIRPPKGTPPPPDPLSGIGLPNASMLTDAGGAGLVAVRTQTTTRSLKCVSAVAKTVTSILVFLIGLLGLQIPGEDASKIVMEMITKSSKLEPIIDLLKEMNRTDDAGGLALVIAKIFRTLWDEGIFSKALKASLSTVRWWDYTLMAVQSAATVAAWVSTGGIALVATIGLSIFDAIDIFNGVKEVVKEC